MLANFTFMVELRNALSHVRLPLLNLVYLYYGLMWGFSMYLQYFEYKRGLPHAWYTHLMFWGLNCLCQSSILVIVIKFEDSVLEHPEDHVAKMQVYITQAIMAVGSLFLFVAGLIWQKDYRFNENRGRNYLPRGSRKSGLFASFGGGLRESMLSRSNSSNLRGSPIPESQQPVALPKLQANVKNLFFQDELLICEIYVYKDEKLHLKLKRDYNTLTELE